MDPPRCALTAIHFPEHRTLTGDDTTAEPLPAALQQLAATAEALLDGSGHRPTGAKPAGGNSVHQPAAVTGFEPLHHSMAQHDGSTVADGTAGKDAAVEMSNAAVAMRGAGAAPERVHHHAAGHDPVWLLLYAVKVKMAPKYVHSRLRV